MIRDIFVKYDTAQVKEVIRGERAHTIATTTALGVSHKEAFTGLGTKLCLQFNRDVSKTSDTPDLQIRHIGLGVLENLERCDVLR
jgi:hypothetical protein